MSLMATYVYMTMLCHSLLPKSCYHLFLSTCCRAGEGGRQEQQMRADLARFKQQVQAQRDAAALQLQRLQQVLPVDSASEAASALSASTASSKPLTLFQHVYFL